MLLVACAPPQRPDRESPIPASEPPETTDQATPEAANEAPDTSDQDIEAALVGRWECLDTSAPHEWVCLLIFDENGRFIDRDGDEGTFIVSGDTLTLQFDEATFGFFTFNFRMRENQLILTEDGLRIVLNRATGEAPESTASDQGIEAALAGRWECRDTTQPHIWLCLLIFDENGRFVDGDGDEGSFSISGNSLTLQFDQVMFGTHTITFDLSEDQLILTGDGARIVLHRSPLIIAS